jgi:glycosyltransferase involved in cell wall biosynthesis
LHFFGKGYRQVFENFNHLKRLLSIITIAMPQESAPLGDAPKSKILLISSSRLGGPFPQRPDHLLRALKKLGYSTLACDGYNPILGIIHALKNRGVDNKVFSGFRAGLAGLFLGFFGLEWIYDFVEVKSKLCRDNWTGIKRRVVPLIDGLERLMIKRAKIVFAAGESAYQHAKSLRPDAILVSNGYDESIFDPNKYNREELRRKYGVDFPLAVYIGKLIPMYAKFLIPVIDAIALLNREYPNAEFWVYGDGLSRSELERKAKEKKCNVKFKGYIDHEKVPEIVTIADVGIHAYDTESLKLIEWLSMGLPTVVPLPLHVDGAVSCPWDPNSIALTVSKLLKNPVRRPLRMPTWDEVASILVKHLNISLD